MRINMTKSVRDGEGFSIQRIVVAFLVVLGFVGSGLATSPVEAAPANAAVVAVSAAAERPPGLGESAVRDGRLAMPGTKAQIGGQCAEAAKVAWANRWNPWPSRYVIAAIGMAAACGYWIGGMWSNRAQQAWNTCWPNCPWYYAFKFW